MPRIAINFEKCVIYKIVCNDLNITDIYVGSTTDFNKMKSTHKTRSININTKFNIKLYEMIRANGGWDNWVMLEIEKFTTCKDANEAHTRERYWLEQLKPTLQTILKKDERDRKEYMEVYRILNQEKIQEYSKIYQEYKSTKTICNICSRLYTMGHKIEHLKTKIHLKAIEKLLLEPTQIV